MNNNSTAYPFIPLARILTSLGQLGFARWKKPLADFLEKEIESGELPECKHALKEFWKPCLEVNTEKYRQKTLEEPEDREESIYFSTKE
jgi:hypothetical protein